MVTGILDKFNPVPAFACLDPDWENGRSVSRAGRNQHIRHAPGYLGAEAIRGNDGSSGRGHSLGQRRTTKAGPVD